MRAAAPALAASAALALAACAQAPATSLLRHPNTAADAPTSAAVESVAGAAIVFISGQTPERRMDGTWGDDEAQAASALSKVDARLAALGLGRADLAKMQVFLVAPAGDDGEATRAAFGRAWGRWLAAAPAAKPARSVVQVAGLGHAGVHVEVDAIAARR